MGKKGPIDAAADREKEVTNPMKADGILQNSLERYRVLFNHINDAVFVYHPNSDFSAGQFIEVNDEASRMYGYSRKEFSQLTPLDLNASKEGSGFRKRRKRLLAEKHILFETTHATKDGRIFPVEIHSHMADIGKRPTIISIVRDITLRKRRERALERSEKKYAKIFENIQDVYYEVTLDGMITEISPSIAEISGFRREELIGKALCDIYADPTMRLDLLEKIQRDGNVTDYEVLLKDKDGTPKWGSISAKLEKRERGVPVTIVGSLRDISDRKRMEQALRENETQMRAILDASIDRIRYVDKDLKIIWANKTIAEALDISSENLAGHHCYKILVEKDQPCEGCPCIKAMETGRLERAIMRYPKIRGKGGVSYWDTYSAPLKNDDGVIEGFIQIGRDITETKRAIDTLRTNEETMKAILVASPVGIGLVQGRTLGWANKAMYKMVEHEEDSLLGQDAEVLYPDAEEYRRAGEALYGGVKETGVASLETRWVTGDGRIIHVYLQESSLDPSNSSKGIIVTAMDITALKNAEEQIRALNQQLMKAQERERQKISRYLHDSLAQNLSTVKVGCDSFIKNHPNLSPEIRLKFSEFSLILQGTIEVVRDLAYDLRPGILDEMGLLLAIQEYCEEFSEKKNIHIDFHSAGMKSLRLDSDTEINLYRLVQEALTNIKRHADARNVTLRLAASFPSIILRIEDNGKGFDVDRRLIDTVKEKRMGLRSMQERVTSLAGTMTIQSRPTKGTKIIIKVPCREKGNDPKEKNTDHR